MRCPRSNTIIPDAKSFITQWISDRAYVEALALEGDTSKAYELADRCRSDARSNGISDQDLDAAVDYLIGNENGLVECIADAIEDMA